MISRLDIAPLRRSVRIGASDDESVWVSGISAMGIASLLDRFPDLRKLMTGVEVSSEELMKLGTGIVAAIIAAGCGHPGHPKAEENAANFPIGVQADLLAAVVELTMPNGIGPLVEKLSGLSGALGLRDGSQLEELAKSSANLANGAAMPPPN